MKYKLLDIREETNLTDSQFLIWLDQEIHPDMPFYNAAYQCTISGEIDPDIFQKAFQLLIDSSDALRTVIEIKNGIPYQRVIEHFPYTIEYFEYSEEKSNGIRIEDWAQKRAQIIFNMEKCLLDSALIKLSEDKYVWFLNIHHIIRDRLADAILFERMSKYYGNLINGVPQESIKLPQFSGYLEYEKEYKKSSYAKEAKSYWENKLLKKHDPLRFYGRYPEKKITRVKRVVCNLSNEQIEKLKSVAMGKGFYTRSITVSLYNIFLTIFSTYLYRMSGNRNFFIETPHHNRRLPEFKKTIGLFMTVRPLQIDIEDNDTFLSLTHKISKEASETLKNAKTSIGNPQNICDVSLNYVPFSSFEFNGMAVENKRIHPGYGENVLDLRIVDNLSQNEMFIKFDFDCDVFDDSLQKQAIEHFLRVLDAFLEKNSQPVNKVSLLSKAEKKRIIIGFNDTKTDYPKNKCIHQLFEEQVERTPGNVAVEFEGQQLSYRELNVRANQLAHYLQTLEVGPETLVGICVDRSLEMVVGLLGILKAGGAYVPLDPAYPRKRLSFILKDAKTPILLTQKKLLSRLPKHEAKVMCLDSDWDFIAKESEQNPDSQTTPENLAYIIYTSGSTGKPKGVEVLHSSVVNHNMWAAEEFRLRAQDRILQFSSISFDVAVEEIFPTLQKGATAILRPGMSLVSYEEFLQFIEMKKITVLNLPTAYWHNLVRSLPASKTHLPGTLRLLVVGGEKCSLEHFRLWQQRIKGNIVWINAYGPTEATVTATFYRADDRKNEKDDDLTEMPIGRPIANTEIYIVDKYLSPVPIGVPGELLIGGAGLARGYLNRRDLTLEAFISNPFSQDPGARLYKTGDLARYLPDGNVEFLGRIDHQVKLRGFRIELGEIETVLTQHTEVKEAVVIAREDQPGDKRLVAYLVPEHEKSPSISELRSFVKQKLPDYMVPAAFVMLEVLPLTPNGKIDRKVLPVPDLELTREVEFVAPRTPTEEAIAGIWADVLKLERVSVHDNFFELGGDSILAIQIVARANQAGLLCTPQHLMQNQTIAELAPVVETAVSVKTEQGLITGEVPLTPIQHWFFEQGFPNFNHFNQAFMVEVSLDLKAELAEQAIQNLQVHHDALRLRFKQDDKSQWQQVNIREAELISFESIDLSQLPLEEQKPAIESAASEMHASLNLQEGPLIRVTLFNSGSVFNRLLIVIHHLVVDGVSWRILIDDLFTAYEQLNRGEIIRLPPKTTSFKDWACRLTKYSQSEALASELDYRVSLSESELVSLPSDYSSRKELNTVASTQKISVSLNDKKTRALLQDVPSAYNTQINDVLLTALAQTFTQWTGSKSLLIDLEGHGREALFEDVDLSRTVGWFTTIFPVLLKVEQSDPGLMLKSIKEQLRNIPKKGIGYGVLRYLSQDLTVRQRLQNIPQPEVSFNYLGQFDSALSRPLRLSMAEESPCTHLLDIVGFVRNEKLQLEWTYSANVHKRSTVERLANGFIESLLSLIAHCQSPAVGGYTPSDFPAAKLSQEKLDEILKKIN